MTVSLVSTGDATSELRQMKMTELVVTFPIPMAKPALVDFLKSVLSDPAKDEATAGAIFLDRMRDGLRLHVGHGSFLIKYADLFPLILD